VPVPNLSKQLGQAQPVPVGQPDWDRLCLSQWDRQAACTKPVPLGLGKVKRDLSLSHGTSHIPTLEAFPCPGTSSIPTIQLVPVPLVPNCPTKWVYKAVQVCSTKWVSTLKFLTERCGNWISRYPYDLRRDVIFSVFGLSYGRSDNEFCAEEGQNPIFDPLPRNEKLCGNLWASLHITIRHFLKKSGNVWTSDSV